MDNCEFTEYNMYNVDTISFVGGSTQEYIFHFYESYLMTPASLTWVTAIHFNLTQYGYANNVLLSIEGQKIDEAPYNSIRVIITDSSTAGLYGKFVYQIVLDGNSNNDVIPIQGILNISKQFKVIP